MKKVKWFLTKGCVPVKRNDTGKVINLVNWNSEVKVIKHEGDFALIEVKGFGH
jgi:L,D-peptidoglycan transpeptidase YkuD (ErfK/YbiS/YcfS/YnhG family)